MSTICFWEILRFTELPRPSIKPSPIQRLQIYHAIATAANNDRGIDAPKQPPSHPIRAPMITTRNLRIRENETNASVFVCTGMCCCAGRGIGWRTNQPSHRFPARSVIRLPKRHISARKSGREIQSNTIHPSINLLRPWYFSNNVADKAPNVTRLCLVARLLVFFVFCPNADWEIVWGDEVILHKSPHGIYTYMVVSILFLSNKIQQKLPRGKRGEVY